MHRPLIPVIIPWTTPGKEQIHSEGKIISASQSNFKNATKELYRLHFKWILSSYTAIVDLFLSQTLTTFKERSAAFKGNVAD